MDEYAILCILMHYDARQSIEECLRERGSTQQQIAKLLGISQSSVSRALRSEGKRYGRARIKLSIYANSQNVAKNRSTDPTPKKIANAIRRVWDGTEGHAAAIVKIIDALAGLRPAGKRKIRER